MIHSFPEMHYLEDQRLHGIPQFQSPCLREHAIGRPMQLMMFNPFAVCLNPWPRGGRFWADEHVDSQFKYLIGGIHGDFLN